MTWAWKVWLVERAESSVELEFSGVFDLIVLFGFVFRFFFLFLFSHGLTVSLPRSFLGASKSGDFHVISVFKFAVAVRSSHAAR
ncbi:MAG: hypothetical protein JSR72_23745 [Proteobacteria bacterium]|nr:hypothetical protein [Pseudomonadota bacterium]